MKIRNGLLRVLDAFCIIGGTILYAVLSPLILLHRMFHTNTEEEEELVL